MNFFYWLNTKLIFLKCLWLYENRCHYILGMVSFYFERAFVFISFEFIFVRFACRSLPSNSHSGDGCQFSIILRVVWGYSGRKIPKNSECCISWDTNAIGFIQPSCAVIDIFELRINLLLHSFFLILRKYANWSYCQF